MTDLPTLLCAATEGDDLARLALADHLEESGDPRHLWARELALWRWSRPDLGDPLPRMLAAIEGGIDFGAAIRGLVLLGERALGPMLERFANFEEYAAVQVVAEIGAEPVLPQIDRFLREGTPEQREAACYLARDVGRRARPLLPALLGVIEANASQGVHAAAEAVAEMGPLDDAAVGRLLAMFAPGGAWHGEKARRLRVPVLASVLGEAAAALMPPEPPDIPAADMARWFRDLIDHSSSSSSSSDDWAERQRVLEAFRRQDAPDADLVVAVLDFTIYFQYSAPDPHLARHLPRHHEARRRLREWLYGPEDTAAIALGVVAHVAAEMPDLFDDAVAAVDGPNAKHARRALARFGERGVNLLVARLAAAVVPRERNALLDSLIFADSLPRSVLPFVDEAADDPDVGPARAMHLWRLILPPEELFARIRPYLTDTRPNVRPTAVQVLAHGGPSEEVKAVLSPILRDDNTGVREAAFESLLALEADEAARIALFRAMLSDPCPDLRERVIRRCGEENARALAPDLRIHLEKPNARTRAAAADVLRGWGELGGRSGA